MVISIRAYGLKKQLPLNKSQEVETNFLNMAQSPLSSIPLNDFEGTEKVSTKVASTNIFIKL